MKIVAKFIGKVIEFNQPPTPSYVVLKNMDSGEVCETEAVSEKLLEKEINHNNCEFQILIEQNEVGTNVSTLTKLEPHTLSDADLKAISDEVDAKLPPSEPTCFDI